MSEYTGVSTIGVKNFVIRSERNESARLSGNVVRVPRTVAVSSSATQHERIAVDPNVLGGEPHVRGTRIPIAVILDGLDEGMTADELRQHYPRLTEEDIRAAVEYAASKSLLPAE